MSFPEILTQLIDTLSAEEKIILIDDVDEPERFKVIPNFERRDEISIKALDTIRAINSYLSEHTCSFLSSEDTRIFREILSALSKTEEANQRSTLSLNNNLVTFNLLCDRYKSKIKARKKEAEKENHEWANMVFYLSVGFLFVVVASVILGNQMSATGDIQRLQQQVQALEKACSRL